MKNYYTAAEAQKRLGIDDNNFYYLVRTNKIKKHIPPGKKQGLYPKSEIDRLAREMIAFMTYDERTGLVFMKATNDEDYNEEHELATLLFGNSVHSMETRKAWLAVNPDLDFIVRDHGRLAGFINLLPAKNEAIRQFMEGKIRGWEIKPEDVLPFTPGSTMECILMGMATAPDVDITRRTQYGAKLLAGLLEFLRSLAEKNITITKFHATSSTPTGIAILKNADFEEINNIGKRTAFELDIMKSNGRIAREYKEALEKAHKKKARKPQTLKVEIVEKVEGSIQEASEQQSTEAATKAI